MTKRQLNTFFKVFKFTMSSINKQIAALEKAIKALKVAAKAQKSEKKAPKKVSKKSEKPKKISDCVKKSDLKAFTKAELIQWAKDNDCKVKGILKQLKDDLIELVWKNIKTAQVNDDDSESNSSGSESESSSSDSSCDSDSD